jgi:hypothetical protein
VSTLSAPGIALGTFLLPLQKYSSLPPPLAGFQVLGYGFGSLNSMNFWAKTQFGGPKQGLNAEGGTVISPMHPWTPPPKQKTYSVSLQMFKLLVQNLAVLFTRSRSWNPHAGIAPWRKICSWPLLPELPSIKLCYVKTVTSPLGTQLSHLWNRIK